MISLELEGGVYQQIGPTDQIAEYVFPSGMEVGINPQVENAFHILAPASWSINESYTDGRVCRVEVDGVEYFAKMHRDRLSLNYYSRSSRDEVLITQRLQKASQQFFHPSLRFSWEKPIGYVKGSEWREHAVFAKEDNLQLNPREDIIAWILDNREQYKDSYHHLQAILANARENMLNGELESPFIFGVHEIGDITFEQYAYIHSIFLLRRAKDLQRVILLAYGYEDIDPNQNYQFRFSRGILEVVSYDVHYYIDRSDGLSSIMQHYKRPWQYRQADIPFWMVGPLGANVEDAVRLHDPTELLAYHLLMVEEGEKQEEYLEPFFQRVLHES